MPVLSKLFRNLCIRILSGAGISKSNGTSRHQVCIFKPDRIGDFILASGAIHYIVQQFGEQNCVLVVSQVTQALAANEFPNVKLVTLEKVDGGIKKRALPMYFTARKSLQKLEFDNCLCLRHARDEADEIILSWINTRNLVIHRNEATKMSVDVNGGNSERIYGLDLLKHHHLLQRYYDTTLPINTVEPRLSFKWRNTTNRLVVTAFGSREIRTYPANLLAQVLASISSKTRLEIVICGTYGQKEPIETLCGETVRLCGCGIECAYFDSLLEFFNFTCDSKAILTMETASAHFATAIDMPAVIIIGGGHYGIYGPWVKSAKQKWLTNPLECFGCNWKCKYEKAKCICDIPGERIVDTLLSILEK